MKHRKVYIIAGPNGSGKTTFANKFLPSYAKCSNFVNADLIAQGLSPFSPRAAAIKAGRLVLEQIRRLADKKVDFAFETTLSGKFYVSFLKELKKKSYSINIFFLWIPNAELAISRIKDRVASGGHDVPSADVKRRFHRGIYNFLNYYKPLADTWLFFNNADAVPKLIAREKDGEIEVLDKILFETITRLTKKGDE
jgi:predicted ABC-type ATPase